MRPVEPVEVVPAAPPRRPAEITLHVPRRSAEGFVLVTLKKLDGGYLGPQGEFYPLLPPVSWLTEMYGIPESLQNVRSDVFFLHVPNKDRTGFTRVTLRRYEGGFLGPQGEFYPLVPSVAHLTEMYGVPQPEPAVQTGAIHIRVPKKSGDGFVDVELKRHERGYLGPQGELYPELPSADRLADVYGRQ